MDVDRLASRANPVVATILRSPLHALLSPGLMLISFEGRRSGRRYTLPVGYQRHGDVVTVLATRASRKRWWRNFREPRAADLLIRGAWRHGTACALPADSSAFRTAVETTFERLPRLAGQFGIRYRRGRPIPAADWKIVASDAAVVRIELA